MDAEETPEAGTYTGYLLSWRYEGMRWPELAETASAGVSTHPYAQAPNWSRLVLRSKEPLLGELAPEGRATTFTYPFILRQGQSAAHHFLLASVHADLVGVLLDRLNRADLYAAPIVDVAGLVSRLATDESRYRMTAVFGRLDKFGQTLRSMTLYGEDLARAALFLELRTILKPYRVQLRDVDARVDTLSVASQGKVSSIRSGPTYFGFIDNALTFINHKWVKWPKSFPGQGAR